MQGREPVLDAEQCVVLRNTLTARRRTRLDLTGTQSNDQISDQRVLCLAGAVRNHDSPPVRL